MWIVWGGSRSGRSRFVLELGLWKLRVIKIVFYRVMVDVGRVT